MALISPSPEDWKRLYDAAAQFKTLACWQWMRETDIFGIQDPQTGQIGYCCILGNAGEFFALSLYRGTEGLEGCMRIQTDPIDHPHDHDALYHQDCLIACFIDRQDLDARDLKTIKSLGLKFRGRGNWPQFRDYLPSFAPWHLDKDQSIFLTHALLQAIEVSLMRRQNPEMFNPPRPDHFLIRVPEHQNGKITWKDQWKLPAPVRKTPQRAVPVDEVGLQRLKKHLKQRSDVWEIDMFFNPATVKENAERPYFPYMLAVLDADSELALHLHLCPYNDHVSEFRSCLTDFFRQQHFFPQCIRIQNDHVLDVIEPIASRLGIRIQKLEYLEAMNTFRDAMLDIF